MFSGDICARGFDMIGKIGDQQGESAEASAHYEKFLDLWKGANPGNIEAEDAREEYEIFYYFAKFKLSYFRIRIRDRGK